MKSNVISLNAPIMGWDSYSSLDDMAPDAAIILDNMIPRTGTVDTRMGTVTYADTGTGKPVESVISVNTANKSMLLACSDGAVFDITDPDSIGTIAGASTFTTDRWQSRNFRAVGGAGVMLMCNGKDNAQVLASPYTSLTPLVDTDSVGTKFIGVEVFKGRAYYWKDEDDSFYYANAGSYQGNLTRFPLGSFIQRGGKLVMIATWTQTDSGDGKDDFLVFVFSTGEILTYQGDDPSSAGFFEMVGRYFTAQPLSIRGKSNYGTDTLIMTKDGYLNLSTIVQEGQTSGVPAFSRMIHGAILDRTRLRSGFYGWDCQPFPKQGLFIFNVPLSETTFEQHVLNTVTRSWCRFTNINVNCFEGHGDDIYGGASDGTVIGVLQGQNDLGKAIDFTVLPSYNYLGESGYQKHLTAIQILSTHPDPSLIQLTGYADFETRDFLGAPPPIPSRTQGEWDVSYWDEHYWSPGDHARTTKGWQNISAYGFAVSYLVRFSLLSDSASWRSTNLRYNISGAN